MPDSFWAALLADSLVATASAGMTALVVSLLPVALFDGGQLFRYSKLRWSIAFGLAATGFVLIVLPDAANWMAVESDMGVWLIATSVFIAIAIAIYLVAVRRTRRLETRESVTADAD
jgi:hypothetical protein